ncbi:MAG TPA: acetate/propionate family kinase [Vicinamibacterales bacterium]|jgi:acetate kinase
MPSPSGILTLNTGSSSVKLAFYGNDDQPTLRFRISVERVGQAGSRLTATAPHNGASATASVDATNHRAALLGALNYARRSFAFAVDAVGHRVVHGGATHATPERITEALLADLQQLAAIDPTHMPHAVETIQTMAREYPAAVQVACFDTAFHRTMPAVAQRYALPRWTLEAGVRRYGFHGLSCEFVLGALERLDPGAINDRLLIAHLGNGASVTAVVRGVSVDTTMGFSPTGGLMMGTRCGDLDPTVLTYLAEARHTDVDALQRLVNNESGLLGVSELSADMRDLLAQPDSPAAAEAIELFCYTARKHIGALAAVLDGVDTLVFTGGIGEHAPTVRDRICHGLRHLGISVDATRNAANQDVISTAGSRVTVRVIETDEDLVIARHVRRMIG